MAQTLLDRLCLISFIIPKAAGPAREGILIEALVRSPGWTSYYNPSISITTHLESLYFACLTKVLILQSKACLPEGRVSAFLVMRFHETNPDLGEDQPR